MELGARGAGRFPGRFDVALKRRRALPLLKKRRRGRRDAEAGAVACSGSSLSASSPRTPRSPESAAQVSEEGRPSAPGGTPRSKESHGAQDGERPGQLRPEEAEAVEPGSGSRRGEHTARLVARHTRDPGVGELPGSGKTRKGRERDEAAVSAVALADCEARTRRLQHPGQCPAAVF